MLDLRLWCPVMERCNLWVLPVLNILYTWVYFTIIAILVRNEVESSLAGNDDLLGWVNGVG